MEFSALKNKCWEWCSLKAKSWKLRAVRGLTLIELLVVLVIIVLISAIIFSSASQFNSAILLRSLAYEVGLAVREAQLYGVAVKGTPNGQLVNCGVGQASRFCASYGVHFATASNNQFFVFADTNNDGAYQKGEPPVDTFSILYGFTINNFCATDGSTIECEAACPTPGNPIAGTTCTPNAIGVLDLTFKRPNPDAIIFVTPTSRSFNGFTCSINNGLKKTCTGAFIEVRSSGGTCRSITVSQTGQIIVTPTVQSSCI